MQTEAARDETAVDANAESRCWVGFAERFLGSDAYQYATAIVWALGADGATAIVAALRRTEVASRGRDAFACNEAATIIFGALLEGS